MDLFVPQLPEKELHPSFRIISSDPAYAKVKPIIQNWGSGLLDRQGEGKKFLKEFQSTFNSSMWELYLNRAFLEMGCGVDFTKASPDFFVQGPGNCEFNVEAVVSDDQRREKQEEPFDHAAFRTRGALKLAGKIRDKLQIYRGTNGKKYPYYSMSHVRDRPFVIAIAPFDNELSLTQNNEFINMVLFGLAPPVLEGPERGRQDKTRQDKTTSILKPSGAQVEMGIFTNNSHKEISAVFFSTTGTFGKAVAEGQIDRLARSTRYRVIDKKKLVPTRKTGKSGRNGFNSLGWTTYSGSAKRGQIRSGARMFISSTRRFIAKLIWTGFRSISIHMRKCLLTRTFHGPQRSLSITSALKPRPTYKRILTARSSQDRFMSQIRHPSSLYSGATGLSDSSSDFSGFEMYVDVLILDS